MNAAAKALAETNWVEGNVFTMELIKKRWWVLLLMLAVLLSALSIVYVKTLNRRLFSDLQSLYQQRDQLQVEWGQLLLEQSTWATPARVQHIATEDLQMAVPDTKEIVIIKK